MSVYQQPTSLNAGLPEEQNEEQSQRIITTALLDSINSIEIAQSHIVDRMMDFMRPVDNMQYLYSTLWLDFEGCVKQSLAFQWKARLWKVSTSYKPDSKVRIGSHLNT